MQSHGFLLTWLVMPTSRILGQEWHGGAKAYNQHTTKGPASPRGPDIRCRRDYWFDAPLPRPPAPPAGPFALLRCTSGSSGGGGPLTFGKARHAPNLSLPNRTRGAEPPTPTPPLILFSFVMIGQTPQMSEIAK